MFYKIILSYNCSPLYIYLMRSESDRELNLLKAESEGESPENRRQNGSGKGNDDLLTRPVTKSSTPLLGRPK